MEGKKIKRKGEREGEEGMRRRKRKKARCGSTHS